MAFHVVDCVGRFDFESDRLDENLHAAAETEDKMEGGFFLNIIIRKGAAVLKLLTSKNQMLLVRRDAFFVLDLGLRTLDRVRRLNLEGDRLTHEGLDKDPHTATKMEDEMESRLLLDVVSVQPSLRCLVARVMVLSVRVFTKICMLQGSR